MADEKENNAKKKENDANEKAVHIEPSEPKSSAGTGDPGRTPGKAEGADDQSATG